MAIVDYPNLTECLSTDGFPARGDGWFLKHIDNGNSYHRVAGEWVSWGLGLSFAPPTKSGRTTTNASGVGTVTFGTPFYDTSYTAILTCTHPGGNQPPLALMTNRTASGFTFQTVYSRTGNNVGNITVAWLCTRDYNV